MSLEDLRVVVTGGGQDFGRALAIALAGRGAEVYLSSRNLASAERTRDDIRANGHERVHAFLCDLTSPSSIRAFATEVAEHTDHVDVLVNNGAAWLEGFDLDSAEDDEIVATVTAGGAGTILMTKSFLPLLTASQRPDIVTMVSSAAFPNYHACRGHPAFYAQKGAQAAFTDILSKRLRPLNVRVISLFPPDFDNADPYDDEREPLSRTADDTLTSASVVDCILFAIGQPRDCFIKAFHFEPGPEAR
ncbi:MAG: hypothetical protein QOG93_219 [Gaiellaceae bacterium]|jgi:NAD(P)-dependent dehydrogenase (short-subunit alcohol dehydrogenase family)|nr:hypothetical protein [Gaiellaceae bacterium]